MAHDDWGNTAPTAWDTKWSLAWLILKHATDRPPGQNPYRNARALLDGAGGSRDLWRHMIQGNGLMQVWKHQGLDYVIDRSARIPYLVKDRREARGEHYLEHLLVGFGVRQPDSSVGAPPADHVWKANSDGSADPPNSARRLHALGDFLIEDVRPIDPVVVEELYRVTNWQENVDPQPAGTTYPTGSGRFWDFRGTTPHHIEKSIKIEMIARFPDAPTYRKRYLLVGYEGGGGW